MNNKQFILVLCGLMVVGAFAFGIYSHQHKRSEALSRLAQKSDSVFNRPHSPTYGSPDAKVRIVEFFDPACETCRAFYPVVKRIVDSHDGKVQLAIRYVPFHDGSETAARILEAARLQDLFWPVTETVLNAQPTWASHDRPDPERIWTLLGNTGLNIQKAKAAVQTSSVQAVIKQDLEDAATLKVTKTPGFFVNGRPLQQFGPDQLSELVNEEVRLAYPK
jgi:protein-disulfide isomerase